MTPAGWSPVDQALMHAARVPAAQVRVIEARDRLTTRARQRYGDALKPLKRTHPQRAAWSVAQVAAANATEWYSRGFPAGGTGGAGGGGEVSDISRLVAGRADEGSTVLRRAMNATWRVMRDVDKQDWPNAYNALCDLLAVMEEAAGLAPMPAPQLLNDTSGCQNHARAGAVWPSEFNHAGERACRWCRDQHAMFGDWPPPAVVEDHDRGGRTEVRKWINARIEQGAAVPRKDRKGRWFGAGDLALGVREVQS